MTKIILNADDFGRSRERNRAIDDSFKEGLICSAGLIVTSKSLEEALDYMNKGGYVEKIHLHINLSTCMKDGDSEDIPLTEAVKKDPFFCKDGKFLKYRGLPSSFWSIRKWRIVYKELVAQFEKFKEITKGKGNYKHVDFHLWYNLTWSVSLALNLFTRRYKIESVRYCSLHQKGSFRYKLCRLLSWNPRVSFIPATNIDYYLTKRQSLTELQTVELYCHPNYKDNVFLDDSPSYLNHERRPMQKQIMELKRIDNTTFIAWEDL